MLRLNGLQSGVTNYFRAIPFIFKNNLWWVFFIPLVVQIIIYYGGFSLMDYLGDLAGLQIEKWLDIQNRSGFMDKLPGILIWAAKFLLQVMFFITFAFLNGYIILIILSPLFSWLSERTAQIVSGTNYPFNLGQFIADIGRGILIAIRNLFFEIGITILVIIASLLPGINVITGPVGAVFLFFISSYFYGFSFMDYTNERNRLKFKESILLIRNFKGLALANGALFSLTLFIPFCGLSLAGFAGIIATVGATLAMDNMTEMKAS